MAQKILDLNYYYYLLDITKDDDGEKLDIPFGLLDYKNGKIVFNRTARGRANIELYTELI